MIQGTSLEHDRGASATVGGDFLLWCDIYTDLNKERLKERAAFLNFTLIVNSTIPLTKKKKRVEKFTRRTSTTEVLFFFSDMLR